MNIDTKFNDVNDLIKELCHELEKILQKDLIGIYLYGSLACGGFNYSTSDIDICVVIKQEISKKQFELVNNFHEKLVQIFPYWNNRIEIAYISLATLKNLKNKVCKIAIISPGETFNIKNAEKDWLINCYLLQKFGLVLFGPEFKSIMVPILEHEFRNYVKEQVFG